jgi:predicted glycogen debranching enzyme
MNNLSERDKDLIKQKTQIALETEWLETNGLGSYSSSTISFCHTRKYHGLLVAASNRATERTVLLSKFDENLYLGDERHCLSQHDYQPGIKIPLDEDYRYSFDNSIHPYSLFNHKNFQLKRGLLMLSGEDTVLISYDFSKLKSKSAKLELKPLLAFRSFHHTINEDPNKSFTIEKIDKGFSVSCEGKKLFIQFNQEFEIEDNAYWYKNFLYQEEAHRGYPAIEDLFCPLTINIDLKNSSKFIVSISCEDQSGTDLVGRWTNEISKRKTPTKFFNTLLGISNDKNSLLKRLEKARKDFIVKIDEDNYSILAGYHWFNSWGRDTFIAAPGLLLKSDDSNKFFNILKTYLSLKQNGLLPNMAGASKEDSAYNCIDASLWMFWAIEKFLKEYENTDWLVDIWQDLREIYLAYYSNQAPGVKHHDNGLLETGTPEDTLSWMDAMVDGKAASPRYGYLIEINALWYNANHLIYQFAQEFNDAEVANKAFNCLNKLKENFTKTFWIEDKSFFADYVANGEQNNKLRPNQLFALGMDCIDIDTKQAVSAISIITDELLTPNGLRTLDANDPDFKAYYEGDGRERDQTYHNGTVWPWLLGAYCDAVLKHAKQKKAAKSKLTNLLLNFDAHLDEAGLNNISEIFDATEPFKPKGCIAQAWSVSEIRRSLLKL